MRGTRRQFLGIMLIGQGWQSLAAPLLSQLIVSARQEALASGTEPVPARIARALAGYFTPSLIVSVRWATGGTALSLPALALQYGDALAITLVDVVLFRRADDAQWNEKLWAHELTHVMQYRRWGVDGFAARYIADAAAVEREAYANADSFAAWRHR